MIKKYTTAFILSFVFAVDVLLAQTLVNSPDMNKQYELKSFIDYYVNYNKDNRKKTSETLFERLGSNAENGLLKNATYVTLGYQVRKSTYSFPAELSTRLYKLGNPLMQVDMFESLDQSWAILNSTQARLSQANWMSNIIKGNLTINAIKSWNVTRHIPGNVDTLLKLAEQVDAEWVQLNQNKQNYSEADWSRSAVLLTRMQSDISSLRQFYFSEQANLFNTTGYRKINYKSAKDDFLAEIKCRPYTTLQGLDLVPEQFRSRIDKIYKEDATDRETTWDISGLVQELSIARLANPSDEGLKVAGNLLAKLISKRLFELNNNRFRSFDRAPEEFFQPDTDSSGNGRLDSLKQQLHTVFYNTLRDAFYAEEQAAFIKLNWAKNCETVNSNTIVKSIEIEPVKPNLKAESLVVKNSSTKKTAPKSVQVKVEEVKKTAPKKVTNFKVASEDLSKYRVPLTTRNQVLSLLKVQGYTIEVLSTTNAKRAAASFKKLDIEHSALVYWAKKRDRDGNTNYRYTVLVDFFDSSTLNEDKLLEIEQVRDKLGGKLVSYSSVINELAN